MRGDHSIKAAETILIQIVTATKAKATLGDVVETLTSQSQALTCGGSD